MILPRSEERLKHEVRVKGNLAHPHQTIDTLEALPLSAQHSSALISFTFIQNAYMNGFSGEPVMALLLLWVRLRGAGSYRLVCETVHVFGQHALRRKTLCPCRCRTSSCSTFLITMCAGGNTWQMLYEVAADVRDSRCCCCSPDVSTLYLHQRGCVVELS